MLEADHSVLMQNYYKNTRAQGRGPGGSRGRGRGRGSPGGGAARAAAPGAGGCGSVAAPRDATGARHAARDTRHTRGTRHAAQRALLTRDAHARGAAGGRAGAAGGGGGGGGGGGLRRGGVGVPQRAVRAPGPLLRRRGAVRGRQRRAAAVLAVQPHVLRARRRGLRAGRGRRGGRGRGRRAGAGAAAARAVPVPPHVHGGRRRARRPRAARLRRVPRGALHAGRAGRLPGRVHAAGRAGPALHGRLVVRRGRGRRALLQRDGHRHRHRQAVPRAPRRALRPAPALQVPAAARRRGAVRRAGGAAGARRGVAGHVLHAHVRGVPPQAVPPAEPQLPGHVPAQRVVLLEPAPEGRAHLQARHDLRAPGPLAQDADQALHIHGQPQQDGARRAGLARVHRRARPAHLLRRRVHGRPGAGRVLRRRLAAARDGARARDAGRLPLLAVQRAATRARAARPAARLRARRRRHLRRLRLPRLRQGGASLRISRESVLHRGGAEFHRGGRRRGGRARPAGPPARAHAHPAAQHHLHVDVPRQARRPGVDLFLELHAVLPRGGQARRERRARRARADGRRAARGRLRRGAARVGRRRRGRGRGRGRGAGAAVRRAAAAVRARRAG